MDTFSTSLTLEPLDNQRLLKLCGQCDQHLRQIEEQLQIKISNRGNQFKLSGPKSAVTTAKALLLTLYQETEQARELTPNTVHLALQEYKVTTVIEKTKGKHKKKAKAKKPLKTDQAVVFQSVKGSIKARSQTQQQFVDNINQYDINFGIGPAGTGKTYLAVACAAHALEKELVSRILLVRPVVEAGENLGFLPGDYVQKIDPYLRPLYDALNEMMGFEKVNKLLERNAIEIAPLAYMRGRTLNDAFIILDESQNCTKEQMKMFLTRIGFGSTAVITGDVTQVDLPRDKLSGLRHAMQVLGNIAGISFTHFDQNDVMRHPLIEKIVTAYQHFETKAREKKK